MVFHTPKKNSTYIFNTVKNERRSHAPISHGAYAAFKIEGQFIILSRNYFATWTTSRFLVTLGEKTKAVRSTFSDCKTEVECEARSLKTLRSVRGFIYQASVEHSMSSKGATSSV